MGNVVQGVSVGGAAFQQAIAPGSFTVQMPGDSLSPLGFGGPFGFGIGELFEHYRSHGNHHRDLHHDHDFDHDHDDDRGHRGFGECARHGREGGEALDVAAASRAGATFPAQSTQYAAQVNQYPTQVYSAPTQNPALNPVQSPIQSAPMK